MSFKDPKDFCAGKTRQFLNLITTELCVCEIEKRTPMKSIQNRGKKLEKIHITAGNGLLITVSI